MAQTDVRRIAYEALLAGEDEKIRTVDVLDKYSYLDRQDRSFLKRLIEGTIERRITIDHVLDLYSKVPVVKMKKQVRTLLRMGTYQLLYMDSVKDHAAVDETVRIAKKTGVSGLSGFINGVLRTVQRNRDNIPMPDVKADPVKYMSVAYSCPEWIVRKLINEQGYENAKDVLETSVSVRPVTARVNLSRTTAEDALKKCSGTISDICDIAIVLKDIDNVAEIPAISDGSKCVQDISSMLVCMGAGIKKTDTVLDLCASPGGKTMHAADIATDGKVISADVSADKTERIRENITRCGFTNVEIMTADASVYDEKLDGIADVVIADVPCSGLGVMGRKNDIKYNVTEKGIEDIVKLQRSILENVAKYVKPGGILMFSTCTCSRCENEDNMEFLTAQCGLTPVDMYDLIPEKLRSMSAKEGYLQLYGKDGLTDGFFIGKLKK